MEIKDQQGFLNCVGDLLSDPSVQSMEHLSQHVDVSCLQHSIFVSYVSYRACKALGWNYEEAARGGLLHDLFLYDWRTEPHEGLHGFSHPKAALKNAEQRFSLTDREKDIIVKHMWPLTLRLPRFKESFLVSGADKVCALAEMFHIYHAMKFAAKLKLSPA